MKQGQTSRLLKSLMLNVAGLAVVGGSAMLATEAQAAISSTKHNLGQTTDPSRNHVEDSTGINLDGELCVFCHTPHGGATGGAPLWNKALPATTYTPYSSGSMDQTMDGSNANVKGGPSIACLSCHDGTQGMDSMINAPGSGLYTAAGSDLNFTWAGPNVNTATGQMGSGIANLGSDLSNDHPIAIFYCANSAAMTSNATTNCKDGDFNAPRQVSGTASWFIDMGTANATKEKTDIQLYGRSGTEDRPRVECGSCHDPHSGNQTFLRTLNTNSQVCLACHNK